MLKSIFPWYSYSQLAVKSGGVSADQAAASGQRVTPDWTVGIGEEATHLQVVSARDNTQSKIVVLARRSVHVIWDTGVLAFSRKLEFVPAAIRSFKPRKSYPGFIFVRTIFVQNGNCSLFLKLIPTL